MGSAVYVAYAGHSSLLPSAWFPWRVSSLLALQLRSDLKSIEVRSHRTVVLGGTVGMLSLHGSPGL